LATACKTLNIAKGGLALSKEIEMKVVPRKVVVRSATLALLEEIMAQRVVKSPELAAKQQRLLTILARRRS
jgi:hypothetical protein